MRFLTQEQSYERPIAGGQLHYQQQGRPTGKIESWRLTAALDGYFILHVDVDARQTGSGESCLFHLLINPEQRAERLKFHFWAPGRDVQGNAMIEANGCFVRQRENGQRREQELTMTGAFLFLFPAATAWSALPAFPAPPAAVATIRLTGPGDARPFDLSQLQLELAEGQPGTEQAAGQPDAVGETEVSLVVATFEDARWQIHFDEHDWPVVVAFPDEVAAVEKRYIRYQYA